MALYGTGVSIPSDLSTAIGGLGSPGYSGYNNINSNYNKAKQQFGADATVRGIRGNAVAPGTYAGDQFTTKQGLDVGNLESALGGGLGNTAYNNALQQREFGQNELLAEDIAHMNKPSMLQQVLGGAGNVGGTAAQIYGAVGRNKTSAPNYGYSAPSGGGSAYNIMQPGSLDLGYGGF